MEFEYSNRVKTLRPSIVRELLRQMSDPSLISFAGGNPAAEAFPVEDISRISQQLLTQDPVGTMQYSVTEGTDALRLAAEKFLNRNWHVKKPEDSLLVLSGSQQVMDLLTRLLCNEGDIIATEDPAFLGALNSFMGLSAVLRPVPVLQDGPDLALLEEAFAQQPRPKFFYTIPNFQNPTGRTMSLEKRKAIAALSAKYNIPVLEDDPYGALRFSGQELPPIKSFDTKGLVVYAASMSKILAPGMRVAFCVGDAGLLAKMAVAKQTVDVHTCLWSQRVCEQFLTTCDVSAHLARISKLYGARAHHMLNALHQQLGDKMLIEEPQGGMFLWARLPDGVSMEDFVAKALQEKIAVVPGGAFFADPQKAADCKYVRLNFSSPSLQQIDQGAEKLGRVMNSLLG